MFRKKRGVPNQSQAPVNNNPTPSAASAAAQAFVKKQVEDGRLSNAAAAAALRSHTTSPAPISELQTKRMVRRGSVSSIGSATSGARQPFTSGVQRRGSNGSLSSRTFRSPSPGARAPPVPAIPTDIPPIPTKSHRRTPSEEPPSRIARVLSPEPQKNGRASSLDSSKWANNGQRQTRPQSMGLARVPEQAAPSSPGGTPRNINFSRPMSPPLSPSSPIISGPSPLSAAPKARPASTMGLTAEQYRRLQQRKETEQQDNLANSPGAQPLPKKKTARTASGDGNALTAATQAERPLSPPADGPMRRGPGSPSPMNPTSRKKKPTLDTQGAMQQQRPVPPQRVSSPPGQRAMSMSSLPTPTPDEIKSYQTRAASLLARPLTDTAAISTPAARPTNRPTSALVNDPSHYKPPPAAAKPVYNPHTRTVSTPVARAPGGYGGMGRGQSVSPARSARFSDNPLLDVTRHQPLARSASPVKSAMKGHSPRTMSPIGSHMRDTSDASDAISLRSERSASASGKKKKSVRVSFEERPIMVGQSAGNIDSPTDTIMSPQYLKTLDSTSTKVDENDLGMGSRPVLPFFGSVRSQQQTPDEAPLPNTTHADEPRSSDDFADDKNAPSSDIIPTISHPAATSTESPHSVGLAVERPAENFLAPQIEIQPATPRMDEQKELGERFEGGIPHEIGHEASTALPPDETEESTQPQQLEGLTEEGHHWASTHPKDEDYSDTDDGVDDFSDAAEDTSEMEQTGGFASLDAILESPSAENAPPVYPTPATVSLPTPDAREITSNATAPATAIPSSTDESAPQENEDWDMVRAYWSSLSEQKKREMELQANPVVDPTAESAIPEEEGGLNEPTTQAVLTRVAKGPKSATRGNAGEQLPPWPDQQYQQSAKPKPKPKSSLKQPTQQPQPVTPQKAPAKPALKQPKQTKPSSDPTHMRKSMRSPGTMRTSMSERPISMSSPQQPRTPQQSNGKRPVSMTNASPAAVALAQKTMPRPVPTRRGSNGSDASDSSFRKKRRGSGSTAGGDHYSMARSMRDAERPAPINTRPMSPAGSAAARKPMRSSVRDSVDPAPAESKGGFMGFGKSKPKQAKPKSKTKPKPSSGGGNGGSRFKSRFNDSSDEDSDGGGGGFTSRFNSRFNDSDEDSDDDGPRFASKKLTPVRGIPRKAGAQDGDSTDLEDSDDDVKGPRAAVPGPASAKKRPGTPPASTALNFGTKKSPPSKQITPASPTSPTSPGAAGNMNGTTAHEGQALGAGTLRKDPESSPTTKRRSFFHRTTKSQDTKNAPNDLSASKWATPATTAAPSVAPSVAPSIAGQPSRPTTPSRMVKTLRGPQPPQQQKGNSVPRSSSRHSMFRRLSTSAPASPALSTRNRDQQNPGMTKEEFPFPPPPIPAQYANFAKSPKAAAITGATGPSALGRPNTSDGVSNKGSTTGVGGVASPGRPGLGGKRDSAVTAPGDARGRVHVYSEKTGKKKKFQGLRRVFGLND